MPTATISEAQFLNFRPPASEVAMFPPKMEANRGVKTASEKVIIVAVKAQKVMSKTALAWALTHVVRPGDCITFLAVFSGQKPARKLWRFRRVNGHLRDGDRRNTPDRMGQISESCSQMILQFQDQIEVGVQINVVSGAFTGAVASEAKSNAASWVILDKKLKQERKYCMEELRCNIVVMKGSQPKVLRFNLGCSEGPESPNYSGLSSPGLEVGMTCSHRVKHSTPVSSPEEPSTSYTRSTGENSLSSTDTVTSPFLIYEQNPLFEGLNKGSYHTAISKQDELDHSLPAFDMDRGRIISFSTTAGSYVTSKKNSVFWIPQNHIIDEKAPATMDHSNSHKRQSLTIRTLHDKFVQCKQDTMIGGAVANQIHERRRYLWEAVSLGRTSSIPPPLCTLCQHKAPTFGKPPRRFSYEELEEATDGFSDMNILAEGGFGLVHRGVLRDGQVVAVKQLKFAGCQGDADFCREVRVLSCAQHRNVVLLIGFCIEGEKRVLVYEYVCNGSLEFHLHGNKRTTLDWDSCLKIAIGAARGLRYLHEDCRVGRVIHRDMRPKNILLTHDHEPLVGDFGLARLHCESDTFDEVRVVGTSGYLAPEYRDGGKITEKVDVYAFGLVLSELITGQKISDLQSYQGHHLLGESFNPSAALQPGHFLPNKHQLLDPCMASNQLYSLPDKLQPVALAASLCLQQDPESRPPMSKVLRILEGGNTVIPLGLDLNSVGNRSGHMQGLSSNKQPESRRWHSRRLSY